MGSHLTFGQRGKILQLSEKMYKTIVKESKPARASTSFSTPRKKRPQQKRHELVEAERHAVREIIIYQLRKSKLP
jgi:hypothetical protein